MNSTLFVSGITSINNNLVITGTVSATGDIIAFSDSTLKTNIISIDNALEKIDLLNGVSFTRIDTNEDSLGLISQDVKLAIPAATHTDNNGLISVNYLGLIGLLVNGIKELNVRVQELENRNQ